MSKKTESQKQADSDNPPTGKHVKNPHTILSQALCQPNTTVPFSCMHNTCLTTGRAPNIPPCWTTEFCRALIPLDLSGGFRTAVKSSLFVLLLYRPNLITLLQRIRVLKASAVRSPQRCLLWVCSVSVVQKTSGLAATFSSTHNNLSFFFLWDVVNTVVCACMPVFPGLSWEISAAKPAPGSDRRRPCRSQGTWAGKGATREHAAAGALP